MYYKNGTISSRPKIPVSNPKEKHYRKFGWVPFRREIPEFDTDTQRFEKAEIVETEAEAVQKYNVVDLTPEEIEVRKVPADVHPYIEEKFNALADLIESKDLSEPGAAKKLSEEIRTLAAEEPKSGLFASIKSSFKNIFTRS